MAGPLIAVVGSFDPAREKELGLRNGPIVAQAGEDIGRELARQGCRLVVYSSLPHSAELDVVRGYLSVKDVEAESIQVLYSQQLGQPTFPRKRATKTSLRFAPTSTPTGSSPSTSPWATWMACSSSRAGQPR